MGNFSQVDFEQIVSRLRKGIASIPPNMVQGKFSLEQKQALTAYMVDILYNILPRNSDKYDDGYKFLEIVQDTMREQWGKLSESNPSLCNMVAGLKENYPIPQDVVLNDNHIVINTVCGETRTIEMTQEITSVEYMGETLQKNIIGDFLK